jgi:hypothetical protein
MIPPPPPPHDKRTNKERKIAITAKRHMLFIGYPPG